MRINHGRNVPDNTIVIVPWGDPNRVDWMDIISPLRGVTTRHWFTPHFYFCLPLVIGNQYGFAVRSLRTLTATWAGGEAEVVITSIDEDKERRQIVSTHFHNGVITFQNPFALKTPPGINLMTIQPPNSYIHGLVAMTGVVETDNIRRDFTFNLRCTAPGEVRINAGDIIAGVLPIPRGMVEQYELHSASDFFTAKEIELERTEADLLGQERQGPDMLKPNRAGKRYHRGLHVDDTSYVNHQRFIPKPSTRTTKKPPP
jgi:hypothetical protein